MAQDMKVLVMHDNQEVLRDVTVIFQFLGEEVISCDFSDWKSHAENELEDSTQLGVICIGKDAGSLDTVVSEIENWDEGIPILLIGDAELDDKDALQKTKVISRLDYPPNYNKTLDSLYRAQVYRDQFSASNGRGKQRQVELFRSLVGTSRGVQIVRELMSQVADKDVSVLITGQSGTGKEVVARNLHYNSHRRNKPFVPVNCGAIPAELLESELFGHEKGAFTGAITSRAGRFELAEGGTLFLDEIGDMPLNMQVKILRVLQEKMFERVGSNKTTPTDVRIIAATHKNLEEMIVEGSFREDLYYRLNVISLSLPPLRERDNDIYLLATSFLNHFSKQEDKILVGVSSAAEKLILSYGWPGNVRQLQNCIHSAVIMSNGPLITDQDIANALDIKLEDFRPHCNLVTPKIVSIERKDQSDVSDNASLLPESKSEQPSTSGQIYPLSKVEEVAIKHAIDACEGNIVRAAGLLHVSPSTLYRKIQSWE